MASAGGSTGSIWQFEAAAAPGLWPHMNKDKKLSLAPPPLEGPGHGPFGLVAAAVPAAMPGMESTF
eukprot:12401229-Karenia_brevis.AAC.1